jgi:SAM-dependent methyltransferase
MYDEGESPYHQHVTQDVVAKFFDSLKLPLDSYILDIGCGPGFFLDETKSRGYTNTLGITLSDSDIEICQKKGHHVKKCDISFLDDLDESVDFIFCRHAIEHSPFPYITLLEYNRVLKPNAKMYIEVPAPDSERQHEQNKNHYSILGDAMWSSLLVRSGFNVEKYTYSCEVSNEKDEKWEEKSLIYMCERRFPVDVK